MASFRASALDSNPFSHLIAQSDKELAARGAKRYIADENPGFPCRLSLQDAEIGEEVILATYQHIANSPYAAQGPIFVRKNAVRAELQKNEVPGFLVTRVISLRAYDSLGLMVEADVLPGTELEQRLERLFDNEAVVQVHAHFAKPGCFACRFERA